MEQANEKLFGSVERITYHNQENGYCVARIKAKGHRELITLVGHTNSLSTGEYVEAQGGWINHKEYGLQFQAKDIRASHPQTLEGIEKYLGSGMIKGIGPHFAKKLVQAFREQVFEVIENSPKRLHEVAGIGQVRIKKITSAWQDQKHVREIMVFLQSHGVSTARAVRIYKTYGKEAIQKVTENPYQLARDIHGIGFKSADLIAAHLGIAKASIVRARAGIQYALLEKVGEGHCAYPIEDLLSVAEKLLEIDRSILEQALHLEADEKYLIKEDCQGTACVFPLNLYHSEVAVAKLLKELNAKPVPWADIDTEKAIPWTNNFLKIQLAEAQVAAVKTALQKKISIITGGPGTGKTTITRAIVSILKAKKMRIMLCSPTGRAAKRLAECTGMEAKTIHRLLGVHPGKAGFTYGANNPLPLDVLLVDEASMVDIVLMQNLLKAMPVHAALMIVGDVDQLPSVGPGHVLQALIECKIFPTVKLTQIFRQAAQSQIITSAHQINRGFLPKLEQPENSDFHFIESQEPEKTLATIIELVKKRIPNKFHFDSIRDIQVLCPMNRSSLGARSFNIELQKVLNPNLKNKIEKFGTIYAEGDKVMVIENDYDKEVFNGDIGFIEDIDAEEQEVSVRIDDRLIKFDFSELDILTLAYAVSIHKSQGSEYPAVVIPISMQHYMMLKRNLIYTGITRGKKLVVMVGQKKALAIAVKSQNQGKRWNKLAQRLLLQ